MERLSRRELAVGGSVLLAASLLLSGCERTNPDGSNYYGSIQEIRDRLGDSEVAACLAPTEYDIMKSTITEVPNGGEYAKGATNDVLEIMPQSGAGETLKIELEASFMDNGRPSQLYISPLTDRGLLNEIGCDPAGLPPEVVIDYDVAENAKDLEAKF